MPDYDHDDLSRSVPQVSHRTRVYKLEDNGASDAAHRRRDLKNGLATAKSMIREILRRQAGLSKLPPLEPEVAEARLDGWLERIAELRQKMHEERPAPVIAPVARRVAREDRRRRKNKLTQTKGK